METSILATLIRARGPFRFSAWCLAAVLLGCPQSSPTASVTALAACEYIERCEPWQLRLYPGGTLEACATFHDVLLSPRQPEQCATTIAELDCRNSRATRAVVFPECAYHNSQSPRVGEGDDCHDARCEDGLRCAIEGVAPACEQRACRRLPGEGDECGSAPCQEGLGCDPTQRVCVKLGESGEDCPQVGCQGPLACIEGRCRARLETGEPCSDDTHCQGVCGDDARCAARSYAAVGASCEALPCEQGLLCEDGRCRTWGDEGEACQPGFVPEAPELLGFSVPHNCRLGLACVDGRCQPTTSGVAEAGQACDRVITRCAEGLYCGRGGRCETLPTPALGERCDPSMELDYGFGTCLEGYCSSVEERCVQGADEGEACGERGCRTGLACLAGVCRVPKGDGEACDSSRECGPAATCDPERHVCRCRS